MAAPAGERVAVGAGRGPADAAKALLDVLAAAPRPAGGPAEARARAECAERLRALGFDVREEPFEYSALPGRYATPIAGALSMAALAAAAHRGYHGRPAAAMALLGGAALLFVLGGRWLARRGVLAAPFLRRRGTNLVAVRPGAGGEPRSWLVAHLDSKSQPVPIALRAAGIATSGILWLAAFALALMQAAGVAVGGAWVWVAALGVVAGAPVLASVVGARSPGALDNASGVATVILAASAVPPDVALGVLLPSAEELGLAGARAWAPGRGAGMAINCDGVDDSGVVTLMYSGRRPGRLLRAGEGACQASGLRVRSRRLLPGILTDGVALADAGWEAVTVSKGTLGTLTRIHTGSDVRERLTGHGIAATAGVVARMVAELAPGVLLPGAMTPTDSDSRGSPGAVGARPSLAPPITEGR